MKSENPGKPSQARRHRRRWLLPVIMALLLVVSIILYKLADRYLIDHMEVLDTASATAMTAQTDDTSTQANDPAALTDSTSAQVDGTSVQADETVNSSKQVYTDNQTYISDQIEIHVNTITSGSGSNKITYYVADIQVSDISCLLSAFADGTFGRNIVEKTSVIASENQAILAINGDYFGFRTDGIEIRNGTLYRDQGARIGAAIYQDGTMKIYDETETTGAELLADGVMQTLSFGPVLVAEGVAVEDFGTVRIDKNVGNSSSISNSNPRTGIGMVSANHYVFVVVDGRSEGYSRGMTLKEFAAVFADLGCETAYNLDGGGSSTLYFMGSLVNNPVGKNKEREVSDIFYIYDDTDSGL